MRILLLFGFDHPKLFLKGYPGLFFAYFRVF